MCVGERPSNSIYMLMVILRVPVKQFVFCFYRTNERLFVRAFERSHVPVETYIRTLTNDSDQDGAVDGEAGSSHRGFVARWEFPS